MRPAPVFAVLALTLGGCAALTGRDETSADFDRETRAADVRAREDRTRTNLGALEAALADYYQTERRVPEKLESLVPKYIAAIPPLDVPACGEETDRVQAYPSDVLRGGQVDGTRIRGTGRWGYVYDERRVVVFVDCLKPSTRGVAWYQERGVY